LLRALRAGLAITFALAFSGWSRSWGIPAGVIVGRTDESPISQEEFQGKLEAIGMGS
jgi:hypothetical protein